MTLDHRGMNTGSFIFGPKIKFFMIFKDFLVLGEAALRSLALIYISSNCAFLCFSFSPLGIFARNHFLIMFMKYPEPQGRAGAAGAAWSRIPNACFFFDRSDVEEGLTSLRIPILL